MKLQDEIRYDASPATVATMLADPAFVDEKCAATGALEHTVDVEGDASGPFTVTTVRTMPTDTFPDVAKKFVGETIVLKQVDTWQAAGSDGGRDGTVRLKIAGAPVELTGTMTLRPDGDGTRQELLGDLKAAVPLLGGKLEKAAAPAVLMALRKEGEVGQEYLAR
jgi:hypothetical protein